MRVGTVGTVHSEASAAGRHKEPRRGEGNHAPATIIIRRGPEPGRVHLMAPRWPEQLSGGQQQRVAVLKQVLRQTNQLIM